MIANKRQAAVSLLKATLLVALTGSFAQAGEFLVKYKNNQALNQMASMQTESFGIQMTDMHRPGQYVKVSVPKAKEARALAALYADKNIVKSNRN